MPPRGADVTIGAPGKRRRGGGATSSHDEHQESQPGEPGEKEPDIRFTLANERTFLAWNRTAITFGVVGLVMLRDEPVAGLIVLAVTPLIWALARYVSAVPPPGAQARARRLLLVAVAVTGVAVVAAVAALLGHGGPVRLP